MWVQSDGWGRNKNDFGTAIASGASEGGGTEGIPSTIAYPSTSAAIQSFSVKDSVDIVKVGVNYLFH